MPTVIHFATAARPQRVLDVGVGMGAFGFMLRQYLDVVHERVAKPDWKIHIEGAEIFAGYENPIWSYAYDKVHMGDIRELLTGLGEFDVIICSDVLEHFPRDEARSLSSAFLKQAPILIATTPIGEYPQGAWGGNEAETHHCVLDRHDFPDLVAAVNTVGTACYVSAVGESSKRLMRDAARCCPTVRLSPARRLAGRILRKLQSGQH